MKRLKSIVAGLVIATTIISTSAIDVKANENNNWRFGIVQSNVALTKDGSGSLVKQYTDVKQIALSGNRVGVLTKAGKVYVKEGSGNWSWEADGVNQLVLSGDRIGVVEGDKAYVKEGSLGAGWSWEADGVNQLALSGDRIGVVEGDKAYVKEGSLGAGWSWEASGVKQLVLGDKSIGVLEGDAAFVKEGSLGAGWTKVADGVSSIALTDKEKQKPQKDDRQVKADKVISEAKKHLGQKYVYGASGPTTFDCSGLTQYVYKHALNMDIGRTTGDQRYEGYEVAYSNLKPGDLVFSENYGHVGIYVGNDQMIAAQNPSKGVIYASASYHFCGARRLF